jgi:hypothetical protein
LIPFSIGDRPDNNRRNYDLVLIGLTEARPCLLDDNGGAAAVLNSVLFLPYQGTTLCGW